MSHPSDDLTVARNKLSARLRVKFDEVLGQVAQEFGMEKEQVLLNAQQGLDRMRRERLRRQSS